MTVLGDLLFKRAVYSSDVWSRWAAGGDLPSSDTAAGMNVSRDRALRMSAVYACVRLLSEDVATLPVGVFTRDGDTRRQVARPQWMERPNPEFSWVEVVQQAMAGLLLDGNGPIEVVRDRFGEPVELWPRDPQTVSMSRAADGRPSWVVTPHDGGSYRLPWENLLYLRGFTLPGGTKGLSPIAYARETVGEGLAAQQFGAKFFGQGAYAGGVIEFPGAASEAQVAEFLKAWKKHHQGGQNAHQPGVLTGGAKWSQVSIPARDAQFIESRKFSVEEIARIFNVPPHKVGDLTNATYSNIEQQSIDYVVTSLRPWLVRLESSFTQLLPGGQFPKWNVEALLRGDTKSRYEAYAQGRNAGWLSVNEIRAIEDMNPIGDVGDTFVQPLHMGPLGIDPTDDPDIPNE